MSIENWLVIFDTQNAGGGTAGYKFSNYAGVVEAANLVTNPGYPVESARIVEVSAEGAQAAATGVRRAYGDSMVGGSMKVLKASSYSTVTA
ncbi:MAG TPA: hypothetical protein VMT20_06995 [Terriglobia bacterium]|nr:hypothetical protein [Terriglobia bacterium]